MKELLIKHGDEQDCLTCDGTGLLPDSGSPNTFGVRLCSGCNGHGKVVVELKQTRTLGVITKVHKYAVSEGAPCE